MNLFAPQAPPLLIYIMLNFLVYLIKKFKLLAKHIFIHLINYKIMSQQVTTQTPRMVESWVMVDRITNIFVDSEGLGSTDMEKMKNLETDTYPGLVSDSSDRVRWVNPAYRRMVNPLEDGGVTAEMVVKMVVKEKIREEELPAAFACIVRLVYTWKNKKNSRTMPCDVWKMEFGGFAWRFDSNAALSLGR